MLQGLLAGCGNNAVGDVEIDADQPRRPLGGVAEYGAYRLDMPHAAVVPRDAVLRMQRPALAHRAGHGRFGGGTVARVDELEPALERRTEPLGRLAVELVHGVAPPHAAVALLHLVYAGVCRARRHTEADRDALELRPSAPVDRGVAPG